MTKSTKAKPVKAVAKASKPANVKRGKVIAKAKAKPAKRKGVEYASMYLTGELSDTRSIKLASDYAKPGDNPKHGKSAVRFALYYSKKPRTVADAVAAGITRADVRYDAQHGYIVLGK